jgi:hypothetical protein
MSAIRDMKPQASEKLFPKCLQDHHLTPLELSGLGGSGFFALATSPPIGEALSPSTLDRAADALGIVNPELNAV